MLDYKTAKQLKEAGFPNIQDLSVGPINFPTLSELIDACEGFVSLHKIYSTENWTAFSKENEGTGKTSEESVANLWLKLNKGKTNQS